MTDALVLATGTVAFVLFILLVGAVQAGVLWLAARVMRRGPVAASEPVCFAQWDCTDVDRMWSETEASHG